MSVMLNGHLGTGEKIDGDDLLVMLSNYPFRSDTWSCIWKKCENKLIF